MPKTACAGDARSTGIAALFGVGDDPRPARSPYGRSFCGPRNGKGSRTMNSPFDSSLGPAPLDAGLGSAADESWSIDEIERLYRKALDAVDAVANDLNAATDALTSDADSD